MFPNENTNTISADASEEDELIILVDAGSSGDDFLTTNYSQEEWEEEIQSDIGADL